MRKQSSSLSLGQRARLKFAGQVAHSLLRRPLGISPPRGIVSFTFDDFPASAYGIGGAILRQHGVRGTYYAAFGLLGGESDGLAMMTGQDVEALLNEGHELGCHTYSHVSCSDLDRKRLLRELDDNLAALASTTGRQAWSSFSYPFGAITLTAKKLARSRFHSCRGRRAGLNHGSIDLAALNSESLYSRSDPVERTLAQIEDAAKRRGWLIFCTHDVGPEPSPYGCTPEHLETAVKAALEAGCDVVTVEQACARLGQTVA